MEKDQVLSSGCSSMSRARFPFFIVPRGTIDYIPQLFSSLESASVWFQEKKWLVSGCVSSYSFIKKGISYVVIPEQLR